MTQFPDAPMNRHERRRLKRLARSYVDSPEDQLWDRPITPAGAPTGFRTAREKLVSDGFVAKGSDDRYRVIDQGIKDAFRGMVQ